MIQLKQVWKTQEIESTFKWWIESKCYCSVRKYLKNLKIEERDLEDQDPHKKKTKMMIHLKIVHVVQSVKA